MDNFRGFLGMKRMDKVPNAWIREFGGVTKGLMDVFSVGSERKGNDRIAKRVYVGVCWYTFSG